MAEENLVVMDGPGPFYFAYLEPPIEIKDAPKGDALAISARMTVDESGRQVTVCIPLHHDQAKNLLRLLHDHYGNQSNPSRKADNTASHAGS